MIAEHDDKTIEGALQAVVKQFNAGDNAYKIRHEWFEITEKKDGREKAVEKTALDSVPREELQRVLALVEKNLGASPGFEEPVQVKEGAVDFEMDLEYDT
jgi:hypothetical protein